MKDISENEVFLNAYDAFNKALNELKSINVVFYEEQHENLFNTLMDAFTVLKAFGLCKYCEEQYHNAHLILVSVWEH